MKALLRACSGRTPTGIRNRAMIVLGWRGGLQLGEVLGLRPNLGDRDVTGNGKVGPGPGSPPEPPKLAAEIIGG